MSIPLLKPSGGGLELARTEEVLGSGWWGAGPKCEEFEQRLVERSGYKYAVTVNSCTAALHLALLVAGVGPGDEVILPALTFISTALAVHYCGATPVFADIGEDLLLSLDDAHLHRTKFTRAIIPVDYAGMPCYYRSNLRTIEDAAHMPLGQHTGDLVCYSFHPVKPLATGDGGAILTNDREQAERLRALRWCGINRSTWDRTKTQRYGWDYDITEIGFKYNWNDLQAALALAQLERLEEMEAHKAQIWQLYDEAFAEIAGIQRPAYIEGGRRHLYVIRVAPGLRDTLVDYLVARDISAGVHYKPLTYYPMWQQQTPPVTEREWRRLVTLPMYGDMPLEDASRVIAEIRSFFR
jgi:perosamine synthetase